MNFIEKINNDEPILPRQVGFSVPKQGDPSIRNEFGVAGYRWGHPQITDRIEAANGNLVVTRSQVRNLVFNEKFYQT